MVARTGMPHHATRGDNALHHTRNHSSSWARVGVSLGTMGDLLHRTERSLVSLLGRGMFTYSSGHSPVIGGTETMGEACGLAKGCRKLGHSGRLPIASRAPRDTPNQSPLTTMGGPQRVTPRAHRAAPSADARACHPRSVIRVWVALLLCAPGAGAQSAVDLLSIPATDTLLCTDPMPEVSMRLDRGSLMRRVAAGTPRPPFNLWPREITAAFDSAGRLLFLNDEIQHTPWYGESILLDLTDPNRLIGQRTRVIADSAAAWDALSRGDMAGFQSAIRQELVPGVGEADFQAAQRLGVWLRQLPCFRGERPPGGRSGGMDQHVRCDTCSPWYVSHGTRSRLRLPAKPTQLRKMRGAVNLVHTALPRGSVY